MKDFNAIKKNYSLKVACSAKGKNGVELVYLKRRQFRNSMKSNPSNKNEKNKQN